MKIHIAVITMFLFCNSYLSAQKYTYYPDFSKQLDNTIWEAALEYPEKSAVFTHNNELIIDSHGGATVWFNHHLKGKVIIVYERAVLLDTGRNDRLSDFNQFWLATEPDGTPPKKRDGSFASYDTMSLFYVGMGGNTNTTTRFRKYDGKGNRIILAEKNEPQHLLKKNHYYKTKTIIDPQKNRTDFWVDGKLLFRYNGIIPPGGFFGFRTTASRQVIKNVKIYSTYKIAL